MSKLINYDLYFIHIPKNGGTSFEKQFCNNHVGHVSITKLPEEIRNKTIAIVRNPYSRVFSIYNYAKLEKSYWHSNDGTTPYSINPLYNYCSTHTFEEFVKDLCVNNKFGNITHCKQQYSWILTPDGTIVSKIVKLENINDELSDILKTKVNLIKINSSNNNNNNYNEYFTEELKEYVYKKYKSDFKLFNYDF